MAEPGPRKRLLVRLYAGLVVRGRWAVLVLVAIGTYLAVTQLPGLAGSQAGLSGLVGRGNPAITAQVDAVARFGLPLLSRTVVVQRDPDGLDPFVQADSVLRALEVDKRTLDAGGHPDSELLLAYPLTNNPLLFPEAPERNTTLVTYLFIAPTANLGEQDVIAADYATSLQRPDGGLVGSTGTIPVQVAQGRIVTDRLPVVELATLGAIALIVGLYFGSVAAPVITLLSAGVGYLVTDRLLGLVGEATGLSAPSQLQPVVVALILGITTDYSVFFLSGMRRRLREGLSGNDATREAVVEYLPIVVVAGLTVTAGVATLIVAESALFQTFGPGLAITVLTGLVVSVTLVPALLGVLGRWTFWPARPGRAAAEGRAEEAPEDRAPADRPARPGRFLRAVGHRPLAALVTAAVVGLLVVAALPLGGLRAAVSPVAALPADNPVREAADAAAAGFAPGILAPTALVVSSPGITADRDRLAALERLLDAQPEVAGVLGPRDQPLPIELGLFLAPDGGAARYLLILDSDPLGAEAIDGLRALQQRIPALLATAGLAGAELSWAGDTALGLSLVDGARQDLVRVGVAVVLVDLVLLAIFLRALVAPLYLLATSVLAVVAALGATTWVFQDLLGRDGIIFYVPFAAAVLLVSLGSDYNIFSVGYIWEEARHRSLGDALAVAVPRSTRAINAAGVTLAVSFALVALIPIAPFEELAFAVAVGVLIDAFVVRSLLVPALVSLVGRVSGWPGPGEWDGARGIRRRRTAEHRIRRNRSHRPGGPHRGDLGAPRTGLALAIGMLTVPASPRWLMSKNRPDDARQVLLRTRDEQKVDDEIDQIREAVHASRNTGMRDLFTRPLRPLMTVGLALAVGQQLIGVNTVVYYSATILKYTGLSANQSVLQAVTVGITNVVFTVVAILLLDRVGRRVLLLTGTAVAVLALVGLGLWFQIPALQAHPVLALGFLLLFMAGFAVGLGPVFWLMISEIYPVGVRSRAMSIATVANWAANFLVSYFFLQLVGVIGQPGTFWLYAGLGILAFSFFAVKVPETKDRTLEEIQNDVGVPATSGARG